MPVDSAPLLPAGEEGCHAVDVADAPHGGRAADQAKHVCSVGLGGCVANLVLAVLGAGQLVLPYALSQLGLGFGLVALLAFGVLSIHSCYTLSVYELHFRPDPPGGPPACIESYAELVTRVLGRLGSTVCAALLAAYAWGGALSFLVRETSEALFLQDCPPNLLGTVLQVILKGELGSLTGLDGGLCLTAVATLFIFPLSSCKDLPRDTHPTLPGHSTSLRALLPPGPVRTQADRAARVCHRTPPSQHDHHDQPYHRPTPPSPSTTIASNASATTAASSSSSNTRGGSSTHPPLAAAPSRQLRRRHLHHRRRAPLHALVLGGAPRRGGLPRPGGQRRWRDWLAALASVVDDLAGGVSRCATRCAWRYPSQHSSARPAVLICALHAL